MSLPTARQIDPGPRAGPAPLAALARPPLSVLHLITRLDRGGSSECTLLQAIGTARRGHWVTLAFGRSRDPSPLLARAERTRGLRLVPVPWLAREIGLTRDLRSLLAIVRLLRAGRYDIVHTHTSKAGALGRIAAALLGRGPVIHQAHGHLFYGYYGRLGSALVVLIERILARWSRVQIALTWRGAEEHLGRGIGRPGEFRVIRSGIDLTPYRGARSRRDVCRARLGFAPGDLVVGTLCRLEPIKGVEELLRGFLRAAASNPRLRLLVGGDGPMKEALLRRALASGRRDRVTITGDWVSPESVLPALDIFVMASRNEGMGRALVEAMACGLPVIGCAVGGVTEVLEEGRAGILIPPRDSEAIATAIERLAADPGHAGELGRRARRRAIAFGAGRMVRSLLRLYGEVRG
jgi:glycosyltransferase involved in cell wall biosynthesis